MIKIENRIPRILRQWKKLVILALLCVSADLMGQKILDNRIEFGSDIHSVKSSFVQVYKSQVGKMYLQLHQRDSTIRIILRVQHSFYRNLSMQSGKNAIVKLNNGYEVKLTADRDFNTCPGCGSVKKNRKNGIEVSFELNKNDLLLMQNHYIHSISISADQITWTEVLEQNSQEILMKLTKLFPYNIKPTYSY